jgi:DNA-binding GntR family transcriptional regulator
VAVSTSEGTPRRVTKGSGSGRLRRIDQVSLSEIAYRAIRESILAGRFAMGERVVEKRVAEELEISRAPVREALRRLAEEGLVVERARHGTSVRVLSAKDFIDIYNLRIAVEGAAIRLATRNQPPLDSIEQLIEQMRRAARQRNMNRLVNLELELHEQICVLSGNSFLASTFHSLSALIRMALALDDAGYDEVEKIAEEHLPLVEAIRSGDEEAAARTLVSHIVSTVGPLLERLGVDGSQLLAPPARTARRTR